MDGPGTLRRTECKMKETFNQTSFRLGGFDLSPSLSPAKAASGRPKLVSDAKSPRSVVERGLLYAACKLQLRRRSAIPFRMTGTGMTDSTSRHCTRRAPLIALPGYASMPRAAATLRTQDPCQRVVISVREIGATLRGLGLGHVPCFFRPCRQSKEHP